ncbi:MAG TPA: alpha/beta hydrolase [Cellvibrio sp.]|nr:alpha/beta hydrolase [Cellvibrio sp.]
MRIVIAALSFALLLVAGCDNQAGVQKNKTSLLHPCPGFAETGTPALVYGAECGELQVKENPADGNSREISLQILRLPAISPTPRQDPLFLIQGGPGASSIDMAKLVYGAFADVRKNRDLVFVDQRGTGKSNALVCEQERDVEQLLPELEQSEKALRRAIACAEKYRQQIPFYTTPYAVQDLDAVRSALGYQTINLWGVSYGTRVALEYMRRFPQQARVAILDAVAPVQLALPNYFQEDAMAALEKVNSDCQQQEKCKLLYGDIIAKAERVTQRLSVNEKPLVIEFIHPQYQQPSRILLTSKRFSSLIFMSLYSRDLTVLLPRAITDAERGDYHLLASLSAFAEAQPTFKSISEGMRYTVICNEDAGLDPLASRTDGKPFLGLDMRRDIADICALWPKASLPEDYYDPIKSAVPTLLLSGYRDPVTPARWAELVGKNLPNSLQLVAPGGHHSISMEGCLPAIIAQFVEQGFAVGINHECVKNIASLPMVLGGNEKNASSQGNVLP